MPRVAVIGAGAAGVMASIFAASAGAETILLERTRDGGRKILISGGGRCNILPSRVELARFVTDSSAATLRNIVRSWPLDAQIAFFEREAGIPLVEEADSGKLFPQSQSARDVRDRLLAYARSRGTVVQTNSMVTALAQQPSGWIVERDGAGPVAADAVILATGGLSVPSTGSDGRGLQIAEALGHRVNATYPALTPLIAAPLYAELSGVSLRAEITARSGSRQARATGGFLFTHRGYSGPAVLDVSHVAVRSTRERQRAIIRVRWTQLDDGAWNQALQRSGPRTVLSAVAREVPQRLAAALIAAAAVDPDCRLAHLSRTDRLRLIEVLVRGPLPWTGDEGYRKAEVTGGGVALSEVHPATLESRICKGLFLCGEMLDAFGPIGGYNFLWAWATGRAAGIAAATANQSPRG